MPRRETEFIRPELSFERDFLQVRNWWTRDQRIVGNPLSILLYLLSHRSTFRITQSKVMRDLGLGKDAYLTARRKLEHSGFLDVREYRYAAGEVDDEGNSIAGHKWTQLVVQDPPDPKEPATAVALERAQATTDASAGYPPRHQTDSDNTRPTATAGNPPRLDRPERCGSQPTEALSRDLSATADNPPPVHPLVKEAHVKEDVSSSSPCDDDDATASKVAADAATTTMFAELNPRLDFAALIRRIRRAREDLDLTALDFEAAAADVLPAASRPIGDPAAYLATAILSEPERWIRNRSVVGAGSGSDRRSVPDPAAPAARGPRRPPTLRECADSGHRWHGMFDEVCVNCGGERPGWRDDRDRGFDAQATAPCEPVATGAAT